MRIGTALLHLNYLLFDCIRNGLEQLFDVRPSSASCTCASWCNWSLLSRIALSCATSWAWLRSCSRSSWCTNTLTRLCLYFITNCRPILRLDNNFCKSLLKNTEHDCEGCTRGSLGKLSHSLCNLNSFFLFEYTVRFLHAASNYFKIIVACELRYRHLLIILSKRLPNNCDNVLRRHVLNTQFSKRNRNVGDYIFNNIDLCTNR